MGLGRSRGQVQVSTISVPAQFGIQMKAMYNLIAANREDMHRCWREDPDLRDRMVAFLGHLTTRESE